MTWPVRSTRVVYDNPWIRVREDEVVRPDRATGIYGVVEVKRVAVFVVAVTAEDEIWLLTVDRHTVGRSVEIPTGGADEDDLLTAAQRELAEEIGLAADDWVDLGRVESLNGVCRAPGAVFLARGLRPAPGRDAAARTFSEQRREGISGPRPVPLAEVLGWVREGRMRDNETLGALLLALVHLGRVGN
ncbi:NUDIX domain-containing protein [Ornithinimicrobium sp. Y1847]|uniref:NUDIX domain-containing protein n=1 Tax=unclassified Ornithinimicrobium TaxID=2615080 RepID=UPI003B67446C